jgi:bidirectional [NiFe] hydrogenase diaphorase subunit
MNKKIAITIDGKRIEAQEGEKLLWVALDHGIYIPNLCASREREVPAASCRLCFVEVKGKPGPVMACAEMAFEGMEVETSAPGASRLRKRAAELLIASHPADCPKCGKNRNCELQKIARHLKLKLRPKRLRPLVHDFPVDLSHPALVFDPNKCLLCGRCVWVCKERGKSGVLHFTQRGFETRVSTFMDVPLSETPCTGCLECVGVCPVGALTGKQGEREKG